MRRESWHLSASQRICENHFLPSDYSYPPPLPNSESLGTKYLKKDATPSVFSFPSHLKTKSPKKRAPAARPSPTPPETPLALDPKHERLDHTYASNILPRKMTANYKKKLSQKTKIINRLRTRNFMEDKTIKGLLFQLRQFRLLSEENDKSIIDNFGHLAPFSTCIISSMISVIAILFFDSSVPLNFPSTGNCVVEP